MTIISLSLSAELLFESKFSILKSIHETYSYDDGVRGNVDGIRVSVIAQGKGMEVIDIKLPILPNFDVTNNDIVEMAKKGEFILVSFDQMTATPYVRDNRALMSYRAENLRIVNTAKLVITNKS